MSKAATARVKELSTTTTGATKNEEILQTNNGSFLIDMGDKKIAPNGEDKQLTSGANEFGVSWGGFNGEKYIVQVKNNQVSKNTEQIYFRAVACTMGGKNNPLDDKIAMGVLSMVKNKTKNNSSVDHTNILWNDIKEDKQHHFYAIKFDARVSSDFIIRAKTTFINPKKPEKPITVTPIGENETEINLTNLKGAIHRGPAVAGYGIALSQKLMSDLGLHDGEVVYFTMEDGYLM